MNLLVNLFGTEIPDLALIIGIVVVAVLLIVIIIAAVASSKKKSKKAKKTAEESEKKVSAQKSETATEPAPVVMDTEPEPAQKSETAATAAPEKRTVKINAVAKQEKKPQTVTVRPVIKESAPADKGATATAKPATATAKPATAARPATAAKPAAQTKADDGKRIYHISKRKEDDKWQVKFEGGAKALKLFDTQQEAIDYAKALVGNNPDASIKLHRVDGGFRKI